MERSEIFDRNVPGMTECLTRAVVGIAGCGGLGSNVAMLLVRAGVGRLVLADFDQVEASNLNRQHYFQDDIGKDKTAALAEHLRAINPDVELQLAQEKVTLDNLAKIFGDVDIMVEAFDRAEEKQWLIQEWNRLYPGKFLVIGNGISGYGDSESMQVIRAGKRVFCGDMQTDMSIGLAAPRVMLAASMQANVVIELLMNLAPDTLSGETGDESE